MAYSACDATFRARKALRVTGYVGLLICALLFAGAICGLSADQEGTPPDRRIAAWQWYALACIPLGLGLFVTSRLNVAHGVLRVSSKGIEMRTLFGGSRIDWEDIGVMEFRSVRAGAERGASLVLATFLGMATGVHVHYTPGSHAGDATAFDGGAEARGGLMPMGRISDRTGRVVIALSEAYDWEALDTLRDAARNRGVLVVADGVRLAASTPS